MELIMARRVLYEWNASHAFSQKRVLVPLHQDETSTDETTSCDLWVAFFCTPHGAPDDAFSLALEKRIEAGLPLLIYFSQGRIDLDGVPADQERALDLFKQRFAARATIDSFGDEKEFCAKFARDLDELVGAHANFQLKTPALPGTPVAPPVEKKLSELARELLVEACEDFEAYIGRSQIGSTLKIQANGKQLVEQGNPEAAARWDGAFHELLSGSYIRDVGCNGQLFQISPKGFAFLKSIGKSPVGYIAEMGGM